MTNLASFLLAIIDNPDDEDLRKIFADFLEDQGVEGQSHREYENPVLGKRRTGTGTRTGTRTRTWTGTWTTYD